MSGNAGGPQGSDDQDRSGYTAPGLDGRQPEPGEAHVPPSEASPPPYPYGPQSQAVPPPPPDSYAGSMEPEPVATGAPGKPNWLAIGLAGAWVVAVLLVMLFLDDVASFFLIAAEVVPLALLAVLAYAGARSVMSAVFAYIWLGVLSLAILLNALASTIVAAITNLSAVNTWAANPTGPVPVLQTIPGGGAAVLWTLLLLILSALIAAAMLFRPVRVLMARLMPVDPDSFVHKIALSILTLIVLTSFAPLIALGGQAPLLLAIERGGSVLQSSGLSVAPAQLVYELLLMVPAAVLAAGWPSARTLRAALVRLGVVPPSVRQVIFGVAAGLVLALVASVAIDPALHWIWTTLGWPTTNAEAFGQLLTRVTNPVGAVLVGVTAGVSEELAVRGLLQPRIGLIASNLVFASLHAFQYGPDALLSVFILGVIFGIIRTRSNTSTTAVVHGVYDFALVLASALTGQ